MMIAIVAHHRRAEQAQALAEQVGGMVFMDHGDHGAAWGHRRALEWASLWQERVIVLEDDALPVPGFNELAADWLARTPDELVSFYLGTGRPPQYQGAIKQALAGADAAGEDQLTMPTLLHGVAYSIPAWAVGEILDRTAGDRQIDFAIGRAWRALTGRPVVYTLPCLVDHADGPSVECHIDGQPRSECRRAWRLADGRMG